ncbi:MAG: class II glutamine amidotransferase [Candidatus Neomarinimicrobiota bacterium]
MCRFLAYKGAPILMDKLLYRPENSLIHQSYGARERAEPLNGDGFGVGWYMPEIDPEPAVFLSIQPAWNNANLKYLSPKVLSACILAHIRAATSGDVSEANCHPFHYRNLLFMHNGSIGDFRIIKRALRMRLSDGIYDWIKGETDSEHFFALFLEHLYGKKDSYTRDDLIKSLITAVEEILGLLDEHGISRPFFLNSVLTDGETVLATRYVSDSSLEPHSLYHSKGGRFECIEGVCRMSEGDPSEHAVLIVSEKLTDIDEDWHKVPPNHMVVVDSELSISIVPMVV